MGETIPRLKEEYRLYAALLVAALAAVAAIVMYVRYRKARTALNRISGHMKQIADDVAAEKAERAETVGQETEEGEPVGEPKGEPEYVAPVIMPGLHFRIQLLPPGPLGQSRLNAWRNDNMARVEVVCDTTDTFLGDGTKPFKAWVFRLFGHDGAQQQETYVPITADAPDDHRIVSEIRALLSVKQIITT